MAVIEIAKIQVRRGQESLTGMPQLDSGEFGWAEDTEHLYIGKRIVDGAINDENTRILTDGDLDNIFTLLANTTTNITYYRYRNEAVWIESSGTTVQTKLDGLVSLVDYGVKPVTTTTSTIVDITVEFKNAVANIFNNGVAPADARRELLIPAGNYAVTDVIDLPPYTVLKGAGPGLTTLVLATSATNLFRTVGVNNAGTEITYEAGSGQLSAAHRPRHVHIEGMTLKYNNTLTTHALISLDNVRDTVIRNVTFSSSSTTYSAGIGVDIRGQGGNFALSRINDGFTQNIAIEDCEFENMNIGVRGTGTVVRPVIDGNLFTNLTQGVSFFTQDAFPGPSDGIVTKNRFHNIVKEAFYVGENPGNFRSNHLSSDNFYGSVGNGSGFNDFITTSTSFYPVYLNVVSTSGSTVNQFVVKQTDLVNYQPFAISDAKWYVTTSSVTGIYSQITGTVTTLGGYLTFETTGTTSVDFTGTSVTLGYVENVTPVVDFQSTGNKTVNDVFARRVLADQGPGSIVESINVLNAGSNGPYTAPTLTFSAPELITGVQATANIVLDGFGAITRIDVINPGYGYLSTPTYTISGLQIGGTDALLRVNLVNKFWYEPYVKGNATINDFANYEVNVDPARSVEFAKFPITGGDQQVNIQYQISSDALSRKGNLLVNIAPDGYVSMSETYNYLTNVIELSPGPITPGTGSGVNVLYLPITNTWVDQIPTPPTNYFVVGSGVYDGLAAQIVSTGTQVVNSVLCYAIFTTSIPAFNYATTNTTYTVGGTDFAQPSFSWTKSILNNYVKLSCYNSLQASPVNLEYQVNIQQL